MVMLNTGMMVMERLAVVVCCGVPESFAVIAAVVVPAVVGVPVMAPVDALMFSPAGRPVADHVIAPVPPVAATVAV